MYNKLNKNCDRHHQNYKENVLKNFKCLLQLPAR